MKDKAIKGVISNKISVLSSLGQRISKHFDHEDIHDFRTTAKSLRAFLRLLRTHIHKDGVKLTGDFKRLYGILGQMRDAQLERQTLVDDQLHLPCYFGQLDYIIVSQKKQWEHLYTKKVLERMENKLLSYDYGIMHTSVLEDFHIEKSKTVTELTEASSPSDTLIHDCRKAIKDILYTSKIAKKSWHASVHHLDQIPLKELDAMAHEIGEYLDLHFLINHLCEFSSPAIQPTEERIIIDFCDEQASVLLEEKAAILSSIKDLAEEQVI